MALPSETLAPNLATPLALTEANARDPKGWMKIVDRSGRTLCHVQPDDDLPLRAHQMVRAVNAADAIAKAAAAFHDAYAKQDSHIPDSDLDDAQPVHVTVTLGDIRKLRRALVSMKVTR